MERLGPDTLAIFWSAPTRVYSGDVDYEYRQESNLLYLTGIDQPETILVLMPGNTSRREILFIREADARREHWEGHSLTPGGSHGAKRHPDRDDGRSLRLLRGRDVLEASHGRRRPASTNGSLLRSPTDAPGCRCCSNRRSA